MALGWLVTNVDGVDNDLIRAYLCEKESISLDKLGNVIHVTNEQVESKFFFPYGAGQSVVKTVQGLILGIEKSEDPVVQPGDLVAIDEAYKFWGTDCKIHDEHKIFFREHLLPSFIKANYKDSANSEILLFLKVDRI